MVDFIFSLSHLKQWKIYHNTLYNGGSGMGLGDFLKPNSHFTVEETEVRGGSVICLRGSHCCELAAQRY